MKRKTADKLVGLLLITPLSMILIGATFWVAALEWNGWYLLFLIPAFVLLEIGLGWATMGIEEFEAGMVKLFNGG